MRRSVTVLLFSAMCAVMAAQPKLPNKCEIFKPKALNSMILMESAANKFMSTKDYGQSDAVSSGSMTYWVAYSDREDNTTYSAPNSSTKYSSLEWNEEVRIAKISGDYALVYTEPMKNITYPQISVNAKCKGWIPMKNLLLWQTCLANNRGIYNKALLCVNLDEVDDKSNNPAGFGFLAPSQSASRVQLGTDMNFYFIMKEVNGMYLIATQNRMDGVASSRVLYCWVPKKSFVPWNQRSCLEPTWQYEDVEDFIGRKVSCNIYGNKELTGDPISYVPYEKKPSNGYSRYLYRMNPGSLRFPILDDGSDKVYNMSTFSTVGGNAEGTKARPDDPVQKIETGKKSALEKMQRINLGILIDGTSSMEPYYQSVKQAIKEGCDYFSKNFNIRVGVVIYRDYADGEKGLVEVREMTPAKNLQKINEFLDAGGEYGIKSSSKDLTQTEALYYGMNTALDKLRFGEGESNILLVIGDCGNDGADTQSPTIETLTKKLTAKRIHLLGFQVQNKSTAAYSSFNNQLLRMMRESLKQKHIEELKNTAVKIRSKEVKSETGGSVDGYNLESENGNNDLYLCSHRFANPVVNAGKMNPADLQHLMVGAISSFSEAIQHQLDLIVSTDWTKLKSGFVGGSGVSAEAVANKNFVMAKLGYTEQDIEKMSKNTVINFRGYASRQDVSGRNFFKPVIFISIEELTDLLKRLSKVDEAARQSQTKDRTPYINAMKALVKSLTQGVTDAQMANFSNGDITNMIAGLNESAAALNKYTLNDLSDPQVVSDADYQRIVMDFRNKYKNLNSIRQSNTYKYIKEFNGAKYYWIPIEDLP